MYQELNDLKMMADMFVEEGMPEVEKICLTAIGALRTVDDLAKIVMRLAHSLRKATPDNDHAEKALDYLRRKGLIVSPLRETPNVELTGAAAGLSPQRPATEGSEVERRVGRNHGERNFMYQELNDLKMMADMFVEEGMPEVEKICLTAIGALRTVDDLAKIVMRLAHSLRKATPDNDHAEKALDYLRRKGLIVSPLRETPNV